MKRSFLKKLIDWALDTLLFVVPILELSEMLAVIPPEYLPWYMLGTVILRRLVRMIEEHQNAKLADKDS